MYTLFLCLLAAVAQPTDDYYVVVFSYQKRAARLQPAETHTFATWLKLTGEEVKEQIDISWCPQVGGVRLLTETVPGYNKTLKQSLDASKGKEMRIWLLKTDVTMFEAAKLQRDSLKNYKALDARTRPDAVNCIHACSDVAGFLETGTTCGIPAGEMVVKHYLEQNKAWNTDDYWVVEKVLKELGWIVE